MTENYSLKSKYNKIHYFNHEEIINTELPSVKHMNGTTINTHTIQMLLIHSNYRKRQVELIKLELQNILVIKLDLFT